MPKKDYKIAVLAYLKANANKEISREDLIANTGISKSRLSEILNSIRDDGYTIKTPPRSGVIILELNNADSVLPVLKDSDWRQWTILFLLSRFGALTFREIILKSLQLKDYEFLDADYLLDSDEGAAYDDNHLIKALKENGVSYSGLNASSVAEDFLSITGLRKDLNTLRDLNLVEQIQETQVKYALTQLAPYIIPISEDSLFEFCQKHEANQSTTSELVPVEVAYQKIKNIIDYEQYDFIQRRFGKINQISETQISKFNEFISHPYSTNLLQFNSSYNGIERHNVFATGLLFYCVETSAFYALGYSYSHSRTEAVRIGWISSITNLTEKNTIFHSEEYYKIYEEMFSAGYDENPYQVKVLFQDFGNIYTRFSNLCSVRKKASINVIENPPESCIYKYLYTDTIRGLSDFARFLRGFGYSVLAMDPPELKQMLINTYTRSLSFYEKVNKENDQ